MKEHSLGAAKMSETLVVGNVDGVSLAMAVVALICLYVSFPCTVAGAWLWGFRGTNAISRLLATSRWTVNRFRRHRFVRTAVEAICPAQPRTTHLHSSQSRVTATVLPVHFFSYECPSCSRISLGSELLPWSIISIAVKFDGQNSRNLVWSGRSRTHGALCSLFTTRLWPLYGAVWSQ